MPGIPFIAKFIATGFYSGYFPFASGTAGSLVGLLIYLIPGVEYAVTLGVLIVAGFAAGVMTSARVAAIAGNRLTSSAKMAKDFLQGSDQHTADPSIVVIDEIVGMWISLIFLPKTFWVVLAAFMFFRIFDITKPPPVRQLEKFPNGWGIMLDDAAAGVFANLSCHLLLLLFPQIA